MTRWERAGWTLAFTWALATAVPASIWYESSEMRIDDIQQGESLTLIYGGGPRRTFLGTYSVILRDASDGAVVAEDRGGRFTYRTDAARPDPLTIEWWAPGSPAMHDLAPGHYQMETCWTVLGAFWGLVPGKTTCTTSNIFTVSPGERT